MLDFWKPKKIIDVPILDFSKYDDLATGQVETKSIKLSAINLHASFVFCKQISWHRDTWLYQNISYMLVLTDSRHQIQCRDRKPDAIDQQKGIILAIDVFKTHRLLPTRNPPSAWAALSIDSTEELPRSRVEDLMIEAVIKVKSNPLKK